LKSKMIVVLILFQLKKLENLKDSNFQTLKGMFQYPKKFQRKKCFEILK